MSKLLKIQNKIQILKIKTFIILTIKNNSTLIFGSSDNNYVATEEKVSTPPTAQQNMTITIGNADCHLLLYSGSACTIINM